MQQHWEKVYGTKAWEILSTSDLEEDCYATPAIVDGRIYVRTSRHMYCFR